MKSGRHALMAAVVGAGLAVVVLNQAVTLYGQDQGAQGAPESYSGVAIGTGGSVGAKTMHFDFRVTKYATDAEVQNYAKILKEKGQDALLDILEKQDAGRIRPVTSTGNQIAVARKRREGDNTIITIVTARTMSFAELYNAGRSKDYPFGFMQVKLNDKGEGAGQIMAAAKLRFNKKKGHYEIESFGNQYIKAINVRPQ